MCTISFASSRAPEISSLLAESLDDTFETVSLSKDGAVGTNFTEALDKIEEVPSDNDLYVVDIAVAGRAFDVLAGENN
jgi:Ni,Fe-hydrogenase I small subunit